MEISGASVAEGTEYILPEITRILRPQASTRPFTVIVLSIPDPRCTSTCNCVRWLDAPFGTTSRIEAIGFCAPPFPKCMPTCLPSCRTTSFESKQSWVWPSAGLPTHSEQNGAACSGHKAERSNPSSRLRTSVARTNTFCTTRAHRRGRGPFETPDARENSDVVRPIRAVESRGDAPPALRSTAAWGPIGAEALLLVNAILTKAHRATRLAKPHVVTA